MKKRNFKISSFDNMEHYFDNNVHESIAKVLQREQRIFRMHHNRRYLKECFYNLQEKYYCGQKDFNIFQYDVLRDFCEKELKQEL